MKLIKAFKKLYRGYQLSSSEQRAIDNMMMNIKIATATMLIIILLIFFLNGCDFFSEKVSL
jgi:hypothetical protein